MKIACSASARRDLQKIFLHIARDNPGVVLDLYTKIRTRVDLLRDHPNMGRPGRIEGTRELVIANSPYILPFRLLDDQIEFLAIYHDARR